MGGPLTLLAQPHDIFFQLHSARTSVQLPLLYIIPQAQGRNPIGQGKAALPDDPTHATVATTTVCCDNLPLDNLPSNMAL